MSAVTKVYQSKTTSCHKGHVALVKTPEPFLEGGGVSGSTVSVMYADGTRIHFGLQKQLLCVSFSSISVKFCHSLKVHLCLLSLHFINLVAAFVQNNLHHMFSCL